MVALEVLSYGQFGGPFLWLLWRSRYLPQTITAQFSHLMRDRVTIILVLGPIRELNKRETRSNKEWDGQQHAEAPCTQIQLGRHNVSNTLAPNC